IALLGLFMAMAVAFTASAQAPATTETPAQSPAAASTPAVAPAPPAVAEPAVAPNAPAINALLPRDLSPWGMFLNADIVVQIVMTSLVLASLVTWTVWLAKSVELWRARRAASKALIVLNEVRSLAEASARLGQSREPVPRLVRTALNEAQ